MGPPVSISTSFSPLVPLMDKSASAQRPAIWLFDKIVPKASSNFCSGFPLLSLVDFFQCTFIAGFRNNFQDHRRVTEQLLETQAAIRKPEPVMGKHPDLMVGLPTSTVFPTNDRKFEISQFFRQKIEKI
jgi:hypothetical protein